MFLRNPFYSAYGLDIGDLTIKLIQLEANWRFGCGYYFKVKEMRSISLPPGYIVNGEIQQPEEVRKKLLKLLDKTEKRKAVKCPWVVADLPEPKSFLKVIDIDLPEEELTKEDVEFQAKKHLPLDFDQTYIDWQVVPNNKPNSKTTRLLIGAAAKSTADIYTYLLESVGLTPLALEFEGVAIARAMITADKSYINEARAILDLGATRSSLIIYDQNTLQFTKEIDFSGEILTTAIAQELKVDYPTAEKLKIENGLLPNTLYPKYIKAVSETTENLITGIQKALDFYYGHFSDANKVTHITMCGGLARLKNLDLVISQKVGITSAPGHVWKNLKNPQTDYMENVDGLDFVSALGLALRAVNYLER